MTDPRPVAVLYVDVRRGPYASMPGVECWGEERDARLYPGPHSVVAHPPCQRWGAFWRGGLRAGKPRKGGGICPVYQLGDDGGCFAAALAAVRRWGGVLEHPAHSRAWAHFGLPSPPPEGWALDILGGASCQVEQGHYGHPCPKPTWLYAVGVDLPSLRWGPSGAAGRILRDRARGKVGTMIIRKTARHLTPPAFADLLVGMARSAKEQGRDV